MDVVIGQRGKGRYIGGKFRGQGEHLLGVLGRQRVETKRFPVLFLSCTVRRGKR